MVSRYEFGPHLNTDAVVVPVPQSDTLPFFAVQKGEKEVTLTGMLSPDTVVYGLGENVGGINKRGKKYISYNVDYPYHREDSPSLYASHNFIVLDGEQKHGFFIDTPGRVIFDVGAAKEDVLSIRCPVGTTVYHVEGDSAYDVVKQFLGIIGRSFIPPRWAFGFGQSRWGYKTEKDILKVVEGYRSADLPLEYVCMDIDYMDRFIDFTVNKRRFPDLPGLVERLKAQGIRLVPIVDAGVKIEPGNETYETGIQNGYFCVDADGKPFCAEVWPGMTHFPDFLNPDARKWFGDQYRFYTDQGLEGFWNDMNEPAIFSTDKRAKLTNVLEGEDDEYHRYAGISAYKDFYHRPEGEKINHHQVHNLFGYNMTRSAGEALERLTDQRFLLFSRSSYIGAHRYGGIWTGDNESRWDHLLMNVRQMPSLNMCGFLYSGADTGGFGGNTSKELLLRWLAFSAFTPLMRDHSCIGTRNQECYRFRDNDKFRRILRLRYRLLPYLYSEYIKAALNQDMLIRPMAFDYPQDEKARAIEDQLLVGQSIMIAPFIEKGRKTRKVYLPEDMTQIAYRGGEFIATPARKGMHTIKAELDEVVFFVRKGKLVPLGAAAQNTSELDYGSLTLYGDGEEYLLYTDDGFTRDITLDHLIPLKKA